MIKQNLEKYTIDQNSTIIDALKKIDSNKNGFVIVIDEKFNAIGTLTDGDIRRSIIKGSAGTSPIKGCYKTKFYFLSIDEGIPEATELFKNQSIKFLPILDNCKLVNIITKSQFHALLLQDIHADLSYDFESLDTGIVDYEIYQRPWGFYKTTVLNDYFQSKIIVVNPGGKLSLQSHEHREEHWIVVHGDGKVQLDKSTRNVSCGDEIYIPIGCKHRLENIGDHESLIITEVQIGDYLGEDDIKRYDDIYGRI